MAKYQDNLHQRYVHKYNDQLGRILNGLQSNKQGTQKDLDLPKETSQIKRVNFTYLAKNEYNKKKAVSIDPLQYALP